MIFPYKNIFRHKNGLFRQQLYKVGELIKDPYMILSPPQFTRSSVPSLEVNPRV